MTEDRGMVAIDPKLYERLEGASERLNTASDEFNKAFRVVEDSLKALRIGIECWLTVESGGTIFALGYSKSSGHWRLVISAENRGPGPLPTLSTWAFSDAPRALRLLAAPHVPALLQKMADEASELAASLESEVGCLAGLVEIIEAGRRR